jgi:hypothetical protein
VHWLKQTVGTGTRSSLARIASADLVQTNGLGLALWLGIVLGQIGVDVDGVPQVSDRAKDAAMQAVAAAIRDAAATASEHAAKLKESTGEAGISSLESISRMVYPGSYVLAYGGVCSNSPLLHIIPRSPFQPFAEAP